MYITAGWLAQLIGHQTTILLFHKWRPINNYFVFMKFSLTSLVSNVQDSKDFFTIK